MSVHELLNDQPTFTDYQEDPQQPQGESTAPPALTTQPQDGRHLEPSATTCVICTSTDTIRRNACHGAARCLPAVSGLLTPREFVCLADDGWVPLQQLLVAQPRSVLLCHHP